MQTARHPVKADRDVRGGCQCPLCIETSPRMKRMFSALLPSRALSKPWPRRVSVAMIFSVKCALIINVPRRYQDVKHHVLYRLNLPFVALLDASRCLAVPFVCQHYMVDVPAKVRIFCRSLEVRLYSAHRRSHHRNGPEAKRSMYLGSGPSGKCRPDLQISLGGHPQSPTQGGSLSPFRSVSSSRATASIIRRSIQDIPIELLNLLPCMELG